MRFLRTWLLVAVALLAVAAGAAAQTTNGTLSGHVADQQGLALPGVTINVTSRNLQGVRSTVTSDNGDYVMQGLPSGQYTVSFDLSGFQPVTKTINLAPTQLLPVDAQMGPAPVTESVNVVGTTADVLTQTAQVATNFKQELIALLPTNRDINASLLQAPGVHVTGPSGALSIAGATSFESLFMVNGVAITENIRARRTISTSKTRFRKRRSPSAGVSAEYGRFGGGVVNVVTKSGGNLFAGSFRDTINDDNWRTLTPFEVTSIAADPTHKDTRIAKGVPSYEYYLSGPVVKDKLWFFTAGRHHVAGERAHAHRDQHPVYLHRREPALRVQGHLLGDVGAPLPGGLPQDLADPEELHVQHVGLDGRAEPGRSEAAGKTLHRELQRRAVRPRLRRSAVLRPPVRLRGQRRQVDGSHPGHAAPRPEPRGAVLVRHVLRHLRTRAAEQRRLLRQGHLLPVEEGQRLALDVVRVRQLQRHPEREQPPVGQRLPHPGHLVVPPADRRRRAPVSGQQHDDHPVQPAAGAEPGLQLPDALGVLHRRVAHQRQPDARTSASAGTRTTGWISPGNLTANDSGFSPRLALVWDPNGKGEWAVTGSFAKYIASISNPIADSASASGNPQTYQWFYQGPSINPVAPLTSTPDAIQQVFNWFNANGGPNRTAGFASNPTIPGLTPQIHGSLDSPYNLEYAGGVSRQFGSKAAIRARRRVSQVLQRLRDPHRHDDGQGDQQLRAAVRPGVHRERQQRPAPPAVLGPDAVGHVPVHAARGRRRQLHAVAHVGQLRGRERGQRPGDERRLLVPRVQAGVLELSRTATCRSTSGTVRGCG